LPPRQGTASLEDDVDEANLWIFDFTTAPDFRRFQDTLKKENLQSTQLTLGLIPKGILASTDTLKVGDLPAIGAKKKDGPLGIGEVYRVALPRHLPPPNQGRAAFPLDLPPSSSDSLFIIRFIA
jgi:hypothetical protein